MKSIQIDGNKFDNLSGFYDEVRIAFCPDFDGFGRNLDAFDDVLYGGFGVYDYNSPIKVIWNNSSKSKKELEAYSMISEIIKSHRHIDFVEG